MKFVSSGRQQGKTLALNAAIAKAEGSGHQVVRIKKGTAMTTVPSPIFWPDWMLRLWLRQGQSSP